MFLSPSLSRFAASRIQSRISCVRGYSMQLRSWHDFVQVDDEGNFTEIGYYDWESVLGVPHHSDSNPSEVESHANGPTYLGALSNEDGGDQIAVSLVAGQTYT